jgi:hypothetical protein
LFRGTPFVSVSNDAARFTVDSDELAEAVRRSLSWAEVMRELGRCRSGWLQARLKDLAADLDLDTSHFLGQRWSGSALASVEMPFRQQPNARYLPKAALALAMAWFLERDYRVCIPTDPAPYDLVVESDEGFVRVQVKSTMRKNRDGRWAVQISRHEYDRSVRHTANGARVRRAYTVDDIDTFFIVTSSNDQYLIPLSATAGAQFLTLGSKYAAFKVA